MALRGSTRTMRRFLSGTSRTQAAEKLPFEKPLYESDILRKAKEEADSLHRIQLFGNIAIVLVGMSAVARIGYYVVYGKDNGATALPRRSEK